MTIDMASVVKSLQDAKQPRSDFVNLMDSFKNPYLVLIACILSLRTNDRTTYPATLRMLELAKTPQQMMKVDVKDLEKAIYPVGFYKNKAAQIIELSRIIVEKYNGKVPDSIDELCKFSCSQNLQQARVRKNFQPRRNRVCSQRKIARKILDSD